MYDPQGGDTGHEWILITNQGNSAVDLLHSKFVEGGSNHGLSVEQGDSNLAPGSSAIIADNAKTFLSDHANFTDIILDSVFSLKNTGEQISFKMPDGNVSDTVLYSSDIGGAGDGNSLQKINGSWRAGVPSIGGSGASSGSVSQSSSTNTSTNISATNSNTTSSQTSVVSSAATSPQTSVVFAGVPIIFEGRISGQEGSAVGAPQVTWSFGDGGTASGVKVSHSYYYPGEYTAIFAAVSGESPATGKMLVRVILPQLLLRTEGDAVRSFFVIQNQSKEELDVSGWKISHEGKSFTFPQNTVLSAQSSVSFAGEVTGLSTPIGSAPELQLPNGSPVEIKFESKNDPVVATSLAPTENKSSPKKVVEQARVVKIEPQTQIAAVEEVDPLPRRTSTDEEKSILPWATGVAFLGAFALLALRFTKTKETEEEGDALTLSADDFEIEEESEPY